MKDFEKELAELLNKHSKDNEYDMPDYVLADYLNNCLYALGHAEQENMRFRNWKPLSKEFTGDK